MERNRKKAATHRRTNQKKVEAAAGDALQREGRDAAEWEPPSLSGDWMLTVVDTKLAFLWQVEQNMRHAFSLYSPQFRMNVRLTCE